MQECSAQSDIAAILAELAGAVVGNFNQKTLLDQIINTTMHALNAEVCSIFLEDKENEPEVLRCVAGSGFAEKIVDLAKYKIGEGFTGNVAKSGKEYNIKSRHELESLKIDGKKVWRGKFDNEQWESSVSEFRNLIALPLKIKDRVLGVIKAENKIQTYGDSFSEEDLINLKTIANVISLTLENARLHRKAEEQSKKIPAALSNVAGAVVGHFNMEELLDQIINITLKTLNAKICSIFLEDKEREPGLLKCVAGHGFYQNIVGIAEYKIGEGFTGNVAKLGKEFNIRGPHEIKVLKKSNMWQEKYDDHQYERGNTKFYNLLAVPLKIKDQLGVIKVENKIGEKSFSDEDLTVFKIIANVIALAIQNTKLHQKAEAQSKLITAALADVAGAVVEYLDMEALLDQIVNTTMKTLNAEVCSIFLEDKEEDKENEPGVLKCVAGSGFAKKIVNVAKYKIGEGFTSNVAKSGKEYNIKSRTELESLRIEGKKVWRGKFDKTQWENGVSEFRNLLALPLKIKGQILGVIKVENKIKGDCFTTEDETIFRTIANVIALAIEKTRLQLRIEDQLKTMSSMAAHRINNEVIRFEGIKRKLKRVLMSNSIDRNELEKILESIEQATKDTMHMVTEFRKYGKPIELEKSDGDINKIIEDEMWHAHPPDKIRIHPNLDHKIPNIQIDVAHISESIKELLRNAMRAIDATKGFGNIYITTELVNVEKGSEFIMIRIEDDGPGFKPNFPVFKPYHSTYPQNTGLGLVTVKDSFEAHGGTVKLIKKEGMGACFELTIPIAGANL